MNKPAAWENDDRPRVQRQRPKVNGPSAPPLILTSDQFIGGFSPPDYVFDGILQRRFIYSFTAKTGGGKTSVLLLLSASVAHGRAIGSRETQRGRVLYFAGENPDDVRMRWIALAPHMDFDARQIDVHFIPRALKISEWAQRIAKEAAAAGPFDLIIIDTSAAYFEGDDENSNTQAGTHARRLRNLINLLPGGPCVVVACHPTKNATEGNLLPRGGGAFLNEMDGNLTAVNDDGIVTVYWQGKFRGPDFAPLTFQLKTVTHEQLKDSRGRTIPTVIASHLSEAAQDEIIAATRGNEDLVLAELIANADRSYSQIAQSLGWSLRDSTPNKMKVKRCVEKLKGSKLVIIERDKPIVTDKGRKATNDDAR